MDWQSVARNWPAFVEKIEAQWPEVDQTDLMDIDGDRELFARYLAQKTDLTAAEANAAIDDWLTGEEPADVHMDESRDDENITESGRHIPPGEDVYAEDRDFGDEDQADPPMGRQG